MGGYSYLSRISDQGTRTAFQNLVDQIEQLRIRIQALEAQVSSFDADGQRITNVATPEANTDACSVGFMKAYVQAQLETFKAP